MYSGQIKSRTAFYEKEHQPIKRHVKLEKVSQETVVKVPGNALITGNVYLINKAGVAVSGVKLAVGGADVIAATNVPAPSASAGTVVVAATQSISRAERDLTVSATAWPAGADLGVVFEYIEVPYDRNIT